jgi:hypothetical protein
VFNANREVLAKVSSKTLNGLVTNLDGEDLKHEYKIQRRSWANLPVFRSISDLQVFL